jgi:hypothetical protein
MIHKKILTDAANENSDELKELQELLEKLPQIIKELEAEQLISDNNTNNKS